MPLLIDRPQEFALLHTSARQVTSETGKNHHSNVMFDCH